MGVDDFLKLIGDSRKEKPKVEPRKEEVVVEERQQPEPAKEPSRAESFRFQGVGSYIKSTFSTPGTVRESETIEEEAIQGEVVDGSFPQRLQLEEGAIEGEIIEEEVFDKLPDYLQRQLSTSSEGDFVEAEFEDVEEEILVPVEARQLSAVSKEAIEEYDDQDDKYGLDVATAFTDVDYPEDNNDFTDDRNFLNNDFVRDESEFVATSFEDQGVAAPFYPAEVMPFGTPSAFAGFEDNKDEAFEADFSFGG